VVYRHLGNRNLDVVFPGFENSVREFPGFLG
jgi:hypothetical protein